MLFSAKIQLTTDDKATCINGLNYIRQPLLHTNESQLIFEGKRFKIFKKQVKLLQLHKSNATLKAVADETT